MAIGLYSRRYRRGWFGETHRHYLASKGISTGRFSRPKQYFANRLGWGAPLKKESITAYHAGFAGKGKPYLADGFTPNPDYVPPKTREQIEAEMRVVNPYLIDNSDRKISKYRLALAAAGSGYAQELPTVAPYVPMAEATAAPSKEYAPPVEPVVSVEPVKEETAPVQEETQVEVSGVPGASLGVAAMTPRKPKVEAIPTPGTPPEESEFQILGS